MGLLPTIIIVSLLGFFIALTLLIFIGQRLRTRDRRKRQHLIASGNEKPTRHLTVRSGKVVPLSEAVQTASTRQLESLDLSSLRSGYSSKSKITLEKPARTVRQTTEADRRRSSGYTDLEAQDQELERRWEENMKVFHPDERFMESWIAINSRGKKGGRSKRLADERPSAVSGQRITESLRRGYNGPSALAGRPVEVPTTPVTKPTKVFTLPRKKVNDSDVTSHPQARKGDVISENTKSLKRLQNKRPDVDRFQRPPSNPRVSFALPKNIEIPNPLPTPVPATSLPTWTESPIQNTPVSFFSSSESPESSAVSQVAASLVNAPPPSPTEGAPSQKLQPKSREGEPKRRDSIESRRDRPPQIDTNIPNIGDTSFIDSAESSEKDIPGLRRGQSHMSNHSVLTFASSEISSVWTFGNAQPVAIVASVAPRTLAMHPDPTRLKSKYGRRVKSRKEKALPILPSSPLRIESGAIPS